MDIINKMLKFLLIVIFACGANAAFAGSLGGALQAGDLRLAGSAGYGQGLSSFAAPQGYAPINTRRTVELKDLAQNYHGGQPQVIEVQPEELPVQVHFRTASSRVNVQQSHQPGVPAQVEHASFQDEPHRVIHEVVKPVIQEVREIIQPYRRVTQEIRPVIEEVHTVVHKGEPRRQLAGGPLVRQVNQQYGGGSSLSAPYKSARAAKAAKA